MFVPIIVFAVAVVIMNVVVVAVVNIKKKISIKIMTFFAIVIKHIENFIGVINL